MRPFDQFSKRIEFAKEQFAQESPLGNKGNFCWHKRRWVAQMEMGLLRSEWELFSLDQEKAAELESWGVICRDEVVRQFFVLREGGSPSHLAVGEKTTRTKDKNTGFVQRLWNSEISKVLFRKETHTETPQPSEGQSLEPEVGNLELAAATLIRSGRPSCR